ncbi:isoprenylcysteine carboxyl methyltransferase family protein [Streptococcus didelphis]|uniref:isoprenylcysteine carboxyl methyltransferase family protein n=1 Tax=Streptococcus didelphis TaxID=102886 RepID=UPI00037B6E84|nr:isoprenylcysteine carboxyl methyltransferase family protein [Streptococcus didelphis]
MISMFLIRLVFLKLSIKNEKKIRGEGGIECGKKNTQFLTLLHIMIYAFSLIEAVLKQIRFDWISLLGFLLMASSIVALYYVTQLLGDIWTVKLMIAKNHRYVNHWLFRYVKHPNYFLNIGPEMIGIVLLCHASITACLLFPFYILSLSIRIVEENRLLKEVIIPNTLNNM